MPEHPAEALRNAAGRVVDKAAELLEPAVPGAPAPEPPALEEPTAPREPLPPRAEQGAPDTRTPTGAETGAWGPGVNALRAAGLSVDDLGVVTADDADTVTDDVLTLFGSHRVWERFPASVG